MNVLAIILAFGAGLMIAIQGVSSSVGGKLIGTPAMIFWLSLTQAVPCLLYLLFKRSAYTLSAAIVPGFKWFMISGLLGAVIVVVLNYSIANSGALLVFVMVVLGQVIGSAAADEIGLFGTSVKSLNTMKILSIMVIAAGAFLLYLSEHHGALFRSRD